jgi:hypothetical protein
MLQFTRHTVTMTFFNIRSCSTEAINEAHAQSDNVECSSHDYLAWKGFATVLQHGDSTCLLAPVKSDILEFRQLTTHTTTRITTDL